MSDSPPGSSPPRSRNGNTSSMSKTKFRPGFSLTPELTRSHNDMSDECRNITTKLDEITEYLELRENGLLRTIKRIEQHQNVLDCMYNAYQSLNGEDKLNKKDFRRQLISDYGAKEFFSNFSVETGTVLNINQQLVIDAKAFLQMEKEERDIVLKNTRDLKDGTITPKEMINEMTALLHDYRFSFEHQREEANEQIKKAFNVDDINQIVVNGKTIFLNLKLHELIRLHEVFWNTGKRYNLDCIEVAKKMGDIMACENVSEFTAIMEYFIRNLKFRVEELREELGGKSKNDRFKMAVDELLNDTDNRRDKMVKKFQELCKKCEEANGDDAPKFENSYTATNHYDKHSYFPRIDEDDIITVEMYFEIAREMTTGFDPEFTCWTQDGESVYYRFRNDEYGAMAVKIDHVKKETSITATLFNIAK